MFDIIIIGAGPAGATLARLLGTDIHRKYSVCILDKRPLEKDTSFTRHKACGGLLSPDAQKILGQMGLSLDSSVLENPQFFCVRTIDFDNDCEQVYQRYYYNMDREKFDRYLFAQIPEGVSRETNALVHEIKALDDFWEVSFSQAGQTKTIRGKMLVGADGANSFVRRKIMPSRERSKQYISIQKWYPITAKLPYYTGIFDKTITDYYAWTIQKGNHLIVGAAIPVGEDAHEKFQHLEQKVSSYLHFPLDNPIRTEGAFIERTKHQKQFCFGEYIQTNRGVKLPVVWLGEAAGATSPTSAEGFSYAFRSALALHKALAGGTEDVVKRYRFNCWKIRLNIQNKNMKSPGMYWPWLRKIVMKTGIGASKLDYQNKAESLCTPKQILNPINTPKTTKGGSYEQ